MLKTKMIKLENYDQSKYEHTESEYDNSLQLFHSVGKQIDTVDDMDFPVLEYEDLSFQKETFERNESKVSTDSFGPWIQREEEEQSKPIIKNKLAKAKKRIKSSGKIQRKCSSQSMSYDSNNIFISRESLKARKNNCRQNSFLSQDNKSQALKSKDASLEVNLNELKEQQIALTQENTQEQEEMNKCPSYPIKNVLFSINSSSQVAKEGICCYNMPNRFVLLKNKVAEKQKNDANQFVNYNSVEQGKRSGHILDFNKSTNKRPISELRDSKSTSIPLEQLLQQNQLSKQQKSTIELINKKVANDIFKNSSNFIFSDQLNSAEYLNFSNDKLADQTNILPSAAQTFYKTGFIKRNRILSQYSKPYTACINAFNSSTSKKMNDYLNEQNLNNFTNNNNNNNNNNINNKNSNKNEITFQKQYKNGYNSACTMILNPLALHDSIEDNLFENNLSQDGFMIEKCHATSYNRNKSFIAGPQLGDNSQQHKQTKNKNKDHLKQQLILNLDEDEPKLQDITKINKQRGKSSSSQRKSLKEQKSDSVALKNSNGGGIMKQDADQKISRFQTSQRHQQNDNLHCNSNKLENSNSNDLQNFLSHFDSQLSAKENFPIHQPVLQEYFKKKPSYQRSAFYQTSKNKSARNSFNLINSKQSNLMNENDIPVVNCKRIL